MNTEQIIKEAMRLLNSDARPAVIYITKISEHIYTSAKPLSNIDYKKIDVVLSPETYINNALDDMYQESLEQAVQQIMEMSLTAPNILPILTTEPRQPKYDRNSAKMHNYSNARARANSAKNARANISRMSYRGGR